MKPIIFSAPMVRAILDGRKTQTRRVITRIDGAKEFVIGEHDIVGIQELLNRRPVNAAWFLSRCPYGKPGDLLWLRETWAYVDGTVWYAADGIDKPRQDGVKLRPSIHMPRWASRTTLEIAAIRVARVREISQADAMAEGVEIPKHKQGTVRLPHGGAPVLRTCYVSEFANLWDSINAKRGYGWDANPWVWVIEFLLHDSHKTD